MYLPLLLNLDCGKTSTLPKPWRNMSSLNPFLLCRLAIILVAMLCTVTIRAQTSPPTNSLQLWVRADAGVTTNATGQVEKWADQSGKGNDATQSDDSLKPKVVDNSINGKPVIRFDGSDDYLDV